jgi:hypothetical protein
MQKYVLIDSNTKGYEAENIWLNDCRREKIPFIKITRAKRTSDVHWDYISFPNEYDKIFNENNQDIRDKAYTILSLHVDDKFDYHASKNTITFYNLEHDQAEYAAEELFDYLFKLVNNAK